MELNLFLYLAFNEMKIAHKEKKSLLLLLLLLLLVVKTTIEHQLVIVWNTLKNKELLLFLTKINFII